MVQQPQLWTCKEPFHLHQLCSHQVFGCLFLPLSLFKPSFNLPKSLGLTSNVSNVLSPGLAVMCEGFVQGSTSGGSPAPGIRPRFDEDVQLPLIKVVVLGAPGVGKTSLVMVNWQIVLIFQRYFNGSNVCNLAPHFGAFQLVFLDAYFDFHEFYSL